MVVKHAKGMRDISSSREYARDYRARKREAQSQPDAKAAGADAGASDEEWTQEKECTPQAKQKRQRRALQLGSTPRPPSASSLRAQAQRKSASARDSSESDERSESDGMAAGAPRVPQAPQAPGLCPHRQTMVAEDPAPDPVDLTAGATVVSPFNAAATATGGGGDGEGLFLPLREEDSDSCWAPAQPGEPMPSAPSASFSVAVAVARATGGTDAASVAAASGGTATAAAAAPPAGGADGATIVAALARQQATAAAAVMAPCAAGLDGLSPVARTAQWPRHGHAHPHAQGALYSPRWDPQSQGVWAGGLAAPRSGRGVEAARAARAAPSSLGAGMARLPSVPEDCTLGFGEIAWEPGGGAPYDTPLLRSPPSTSASAGAGMDTPSPALPARTPAAAAGAVGCSPQVSNATDLSTRNFCRGIEVERLAAVDAAAGSIAAPAAAAAAVAAAVAARAEIPGDHGGGLDPGLPHPCAVAAAAPTAQLQQPWTPFDGGAGAAAASLAAAELTPHVTATPSPRWPPTSVAGREATPVSPAATTATASAGGGAGAPSPTRPFGSLPAGGVSSGLDGRSQQGSSQVALPAAAVAATGSPSVPLPQPLWHRAATAPPGLTCGGVSGRSALASGAEGPWELPRGHSHIAHMSLDGRFDSVSVPLPMLLGPATAAGLGASPVAAAAAAAAHCYLHRHKSLPIMPRGEEWDAGCGAPPPAVAGPPPITTGITPVKGDARTYAASAAAVSLRGGAAGMAASPRPRQGSGGLAPAAPPPSASNRAVLTGAHMAQEPLHEAASAPAGLASAISQPQPTLELVLGREQLGTVSGSLVPSWPGGGAADGWAAAAGAPAPTPVPAPYMGLAFPGGPPGFGAGRPALPSPFGRVVRVQSPRLPPGYAPPYRYQQPPPFPPRLEEHPHAPGGVVASPFAVSPGHRYTPYVMWRHCLGPPLLPHPLTPQGPAVAGLPLQGLPPLPQAQPPPDGMAPTPAGPALTPGGPAPSAQPRPQLQPHSPLGSRGAARQLLAEEPWAQPGNEDVRPPLPLPLVMPTQPPPMTLPLPPFPAAAAATPLPPRLEMRGALGFPAAGIPIDLTASQLGQGPRSGSGPCRHEVGPAAASPCEPLGNGQAGQSGHTCAGGAENMIPENQEVGVGGRGGNASGGDAVDDGSDDRFEELLALFAAAAEAGVGATDTGPEESGLR